MTEWAGRMPGLNQQKRTLTWPVFVTMLVDLLQQRDDLRTARRAQRVSRPFAERLMLAVTQVNQCRYCSYYHTRAALRAGVSADDIQNLMAGTLDEMPAGEVVGLAFAQHYAATAGHPDPASWQRLVDTYGPAMAGDILVTVRMIMLANLWGNTVDALRARITGQPLAGSRLLDEVTVVGLPVGLALLPAALLAAGVGAVRRGRHVRGSTQPPAQPAQHGPPSGRS